MRNAADADDAVQECYLRALHHFDSYRGPAMKPWLLTILRNVCNAEFARRGKQETPADFSEEKPARRMFRCGRSRCPRRKPRCCAQHDDETIRRLIAALPQPFREIHRAARDQ